MKRTFILISLLFLTGCASPVNIYYSNIDRQYLREGIPDTPQEWFEGVYLKIKNDLNCTSNNCVHKTLDEFKAEEVEAKKKKEFEENLSKINPWPKSMK